MKQRTTIKDVANRAGVSKATVSNLLNRKGRLSDETSARIQAAIEELNFTPNGLIRAVQTRRTHVLGLITGGIDAFQHHPNDAFVLPILSGVYEAADNAGQDILLYTGWPDRPERLSGRDFLDGRVDGLLWLTPMIGSPAIAQLVAGGLPVVSLLSRHVPEGVGYVNADNIGGVRDIVLHLAERGHRRIAFAGPIHGSNFADRFEGYRQGLEAAGLEWDPALVANDQALRRDPAAYAQALEQWLALFSPPTAAFACTDRWACWLGDAIVARGLRIPEDFALAGFDDVPMSESVFGGLTTLRQPFSDVGKLAVEHLLRRINGSPTDDCHITLPVALVPRRSTSWSLLSPNNMP
jgi:LacI family transcriptional regulator